MINPRYGGAIRDAIHRYIPLTRLELQLLDCPEVQRLRHIAQLGLTERVYPGARHSRFEHALGTLHLATRVFEEMRGRLGIRGVLEPLGIEPSEREFDRWVTVTRLVALFHDLGHAPFSHVTEELLAVDGERVGHETITLRLVESYDKENSAADLLRKTDRELHDSVVLILRALANNESVLPPALAFAANVIAGPIGADRMDYLLRDSAATGVNYGLFDLDRVLHTLIPVPCSLSSDSSSRTGSESSGGFELGVERGGAMAVEGLWIGRSSMFEQVYRHHTRRILDRHLVDYLKRVLPRSSYPSELSEYLQWSDPRVWEALRCSLEEGEGEEQGLAARILLRRHHRLLPREIHAPTRERAEQLSREWASTILEAAPNADPIFDVFEVEDPRVESVGCLEPTGEYSNLRARQLQPFARVADRAAARYRGRLYVRRGVDSVPSLDGESI